MKGILSNMKNKEELEQEIKNLEESTDRVQEYIQEFQKSFNKIENSNKLDTKVLEKLFFEFMEQTYKTTYISQFLLDEIVKVEKQLKSSFNKEQEELFAIYDYLQNKLIDDSSLQTFIYSHCFTKALIEESNSYSNFNNQIQQQIQKLKGNKV